MFRLDPAGGGTVRLIGRLDGAEAERAMASFEALQGSIVADCSELDYISSAGIGVILATLQRLNKQGYTLRLHPIQPRVRNVFKYAGLAQMLGIE
jgi:anti-sigma B factor antagonist